MKRMISLILAALVGSLLVVLISYLSIGALAKSILYAILIGLFVYVVGIVMRINK